MPSPAKLAKRKDAQFRAEQRSKRTPEQQLERLDTLFGVGQGARRERERLNAQMEGPKSRRKRGKSHA